MSFDFTIPLLQKDLLVSTGANQYVVEEVFPARQLSTKIQNGVAALRTNGPEFILEYFDVFFSCLRHSENLQVDVKIDAWTLLLQAGEQLVGRLVEILESDADDSHRMLNVLKMTCYLLCQFIECFEAEHTRSTTVAPTTAKGRKKSSNKASADGAMAALSWESKREAGVTALLRLVQLDVHRLWRPPVIEEEFVNLVTGTCYKLLESAGVVKCRQTRDAIFHVLGVMIKKYNHGLSCRLKLLQLLQHFEHLACPLVAAIELFVTEYGAKNLVGEIMREVGAMDSRELCRDMSGTRAYAAFLVELSSRLPNVMLPSMAALVGLLDDEPYTMRNTVLSIMGEMVVHLLSNDNLASKEKATRDQFLDKLEDHIADMNAFVRSKTLQTWLTVVNEQALPLPRQHRLLELATGRLHDKSCQVRRNAIQLVTALMRMNPFAAQLPLEELQSNLEVEKQKLAAMMPDEPTVIPEVTQPATDERTEKWKTLKPLLKDFLASPENTTTVDGNGETEADRLEVSHDTTLKDIDDAKGVKSRIVELLNASEFRQVVALLHAAAEAFPQEPAFVLTDGEEEEEEDGERAKRKMIVKRLGQIYRGDVVESDLLEVVTRVGVDQSQSDGGAPVDSIVNELTKQQVLVQYLKDSVSFAACLQRVCPVVCSLLDSRTASDALEAVDFLVAASQFGVRGADAGMRRALSLVWRADTCPAISQAYQTLYLRRDDAVSQRANSLAIAKNLIQLTIGATLGDITSLEQLVGQLVSSGHIDQGVIQVLWEYFAMKIANATSTDSRQALVLLAMAAGAQPEIVQSNVEVLVKEGLGPQAEQDFLLATHTCRVLLKLSAKSKSKPGQDTKSKRFTQTHCMFERLVHLLVSGVTKLSDGHWIPMMEQAVSTIYQLAEHPDAIAGDVIRRIAHVVAGSAKQKTRPDAEISSDTVTNEEPTTTTTNMAAAAEVDEGNTTLTPSQEEVVKADTASVDPAMLSRFLSLLGQVALSQLVHLDVGVFGELKRRLRCQEERNPVQKKSEADATEDEMGMTGAGAEDAEAEFIRRVTEQEVVTGANLLSAMRPLLVSVCNNQTRYPNPELQVAATLALTKYMLVSSEFCEDHLQLLFTLLEKSPNPVIRANSIIALGDLTFRFPNLIEPWTPNLYARLRDESPSVRKNTLMVLTHLILNDMVKVKGQISELATCIVDDDQRIAGLARLFFSELSKKGNAIYNIMADMISRLSDPEVGVQEEHFHTIMRFMFAFIQKDRQCESLVEKLCHRFRSTSVERQWHDIALCLSLLPYNERALARLADNFACFAPKLADDRVHTCFQTIITGMRKTAKPEAKAALDAFEERVTLCRTQGVEDEAAVNKATGAARVAARKQANTPGRANRTKQSAKKPAKRRTTARNNSDSDASDILQRSPPERRKTRHGAKPKPKLSFSDDDDGDDLFAE